MEEGVWPRRGQFIKLHAWIAAFPLNEAEKKKVNKKRKTKVVEDEKEEESA